MRVHTDIIKDMAENKTMPTKKGMHQVQNIAQEILDLRAELAAAKAENERLKRSLISIGTELDEHWETDRWNGILDTISDIVDETLEQAIAPDVGKEGW